MRKISILAGIFLFSAAATPALADEPCYTDLPERKHGIFTINGYDVPEFNPSVPIGTVLDSRELNTSGSTYHFYCMDNKNVGKVLNGRLGEEPEPIYKTYSSGVSGVGIRMRYSKGSVNTDWWPLEVTISSHTLVQSPNPILIEFVKVGPITAKGKLQGRIGGTWARDGRYLFTSYEITGSITITPKVPTCSVSTKKISVSMTPSGSIATRDFGGIGGTSPERDFGITLNCSGGDEGTSTNAYVTLTDQTDSSNRSNTLSLTTNSTAKGVKVQVLKDGKPLSYGPDSSAPGTVNQWKAGNIKRGVSTFEIPLKARYIQTGSTIKSGTANAVATFTMSYQ
ncbi:MAG: type 1 fimbrial protein [Burkholderia sp.]|uniref:fimbrial protein n=1 Tax=Burkholderia sp. TaxID=36773 RepID=UPI0028216968|nr:fimbrial protein [Burkholderia sp.]MDR0240950.1 type 1 fimbrial protein [Burkholderia sp.]